MQNISSNLLLKNITQPRFHINNLESFINTSENQILIIFSLSGDLELYCKSGAVIIQEGGGIMLKNSSNAKIIRNSSFNGMFCYLEIDTFCKILQNFPIRSKIKCDGLYEAEELVIPATENFRLYIKTLQHYMTKSYNLSNEWKSISEFKLNELVWLLNHSFMGKQFQEFVSSFRKPERFHFDKLINTYFHENITVEDLANLAGLTTSSFKRKFKELYETTPHRYIHNKRLEEAKILVDATNKTISEICFDVGFESPSHFIKSFKAKYGSSPKRMRSQRTRKTV